MADGDQSSPKNLAISTVASIGACSTKRPDAMARVPAG